MKSRQDFKTDGDHLRYLHVYISTKAMAGILVTEDLIQVDEDDATEFVTKVAKLSAACANALLKELNLLYNDKPQKEVIVPVIEKESPKIDRKAIQTKLRAEVDSYFHMAEELYKDKKYTEALKSYEKALSLEPTNKNIQKEIANCQRWVKAMAGLDELQQEKPFVNEASHKEEFTTTFPTLE